VEKELRREIEDIQFSESQTVSKIDRLTVAYEEFTVNVQKKISRAIGEIYDKHKKEMEILNKQEKALATMTSLRKQIIVIEPMVKELMAKTKEVQDVPNFIERQLPILINFYMNEYVNETIVSHLSAPAENTTSLESKIN